jgi:hypothetical protein
MLRSTTQAVAPAVADEGVGREVDPAALERPRDRGALVGRIGEGGAKVVRVLRVKGVEEDGYGTAGTLEGLLSGDVSQETHRGSRDAMVLMAPSSRRGDGLAIT